MVNQLSLCMSSDLIPMALIILTGHHLHFRWVGQIEISSRYFCATHASYVGCLPLWRFHNYYIFLIVIWYKRRVRSPFTMTSVRTRHAAAGLQLHDRLFHSLIFMVVWLPLEWCWYPGLFGILTTPSCGVGSHNQPYNFFRLEHPKR